MRTLHDLLSDQGETVLDCCAVAVSPNIAVQANVRESRPFEDFEFDSPIRFTTPHVYTGLAPLLKEINIPCVLSGALLASATQEGNGIVRPAEE